MFTLIKRYLVFLIIISACYFEVSAQTDSISKKNYFSYSGSIHYGSLLGYKETHPVIIFTHPYCLDVSFKKISTGRKRWERLYNYPSTAVSFSYYNYGIPDEYGEAYSLTASYEFNLLRKARKQIWFCTGLGGVYSTKKFDRINNPYNKAISTDLSYVLQASLRYDYNFSEKIVFNTSFTFKHFSNATSGIPNNGMNFPLLGIGFTYLPHKPLINYYKDSIKTFSKKPHVTISSGLGIKKVLQIDRHHKIYSLSIYADKPITRYNSVLLGIDAYYNNSIEAEFHKKGESLDATVVDHRQLAFTFGQELYIGRIGIITQGGIFIFQPHKYESIFYQKYGVKYYVNKDFFFGSIVKVYIGTADYMEWVLGVRI